MIETAVRDPKPQVATSLAAEGTPPRSEIRVRPPEPEDATAKGPRISVAMALYRPDPQFLRSAIASLLNQTLRDFEIVIVEDPSDREGRATIESFGDARIRYFLNGSRTELCSQRNRTIEESRSDLIAIMDGDDVADPQRLEAQVAHMESHPEVSVLGSQIQTIDSEGRPSGARRFPRTHSSIVAALQSYVPLCQPSVTFRRSTVIDVGAYVPTSFGPAEDYDLWSRLAKSGARFENLDACLLRYRIHPGQMKALFTHRTIRAVQEVKNRYWREDMNAAARCRSALERMSLLLPERWTLRFVLWAYYRDRTPEGARRHIPDAAESTQPVASLEPVDR